MSAAQQQARTVAPSSAPETSAASRARATAPSNSELATALGLGGSVGALMEDFAGVVLDALPEEEALALAADYLDSATVQEWLVENGKRIVEAGVDLMDAGAEALEDVGEVVGLDTENAGLLLGILSADQAAYIAGLFGGALDLTAVRYTREGLTPQIVGAPNCVGNTIHLTNGSVKKPTFDSTGQIASKGMELVIHELTHVWQYQQDGWDYALEAAWSNGYHFLVDGDRNDAYDYDTTMMWEEMNPEQQAHAIQDVGYAGWLQSQGEDVSLKKQQTMVEGQKYVDAVREGRGA